MPSARAVASLVLLCSVAGCDNGRDALLANLQSTRPEERAMAVKKLAQKAKPEDLVLFTSAAKDPASIVRGEAALALGKSQDERVVDLLGELLGDDSEEVQAHAAIALAEIRTDKAKAYLTSQYARRGRSTRQAIVQALKAANVPGAMASVVSSEARSIWERNLKALTDGTLPEQVAAAEELGKSGRAEAVTRLLGLIKDSQVMLAAAAVRGLGWAGDRRAAQPIAELLNENFPDLREAACSALTQLQEPQALGKLQEVALEKSAASALATGAILALPASPETDRALCAIALDGSSEDSLAAGVELRRRGGCPQELFNERWARAGGQAAILQAAIALGPAMKEWLPKLQALATSTDPATRVQGIHALGAVGDPAAAPTLQKLYEQEQKALDALRAKWIARELPKQYAPGFDGASPEGDENRGKFKELFRRLDALDAQRAGDKKPRAAEEQPAPELVDDVPEEQLATFAAVLQALGAVKAPNALAVLKQATSEPSVRVRQSAFIGLARLGGDGTEAARAGLFDPDRQVQTEVAHALAGAGEPGQRAILQSLSELRGDKLPLLHALVEAGVPKGASGPLLQLLRGGGAEAALAARLLGELRATDAIDPLMKYLQEPASVGRREALLALGRIGDERAAEIVGRDLYHDSPDIRAAAAEALASIGTNAQAEALDALKGDYYRRVRELAEAALARRPPAGAEAKK